MPGPILETSLPSTAGISAFLLCLRVDMLRCTAPTMDRGARHSLQHCAHPRQGSMASEGTRHAPVCVYARAPQRRLPWP